jgi:hypothetical protein
MPHALVRLKVPGRVSTGPQEDEFALPLLGAPSFYRGLIDPRRLRELSDEHLGAAVGALLAWSADWLRFLAAFESQGQDWPLVLKSPNHSLRWHLLQTLMRKSVRIWAGRPLPTVLYSNLGIWHSMFQQYALWHCPEGEYEIFLRRFIRPCAHILRSALVVRRYDLSRFREPHGRTPHLAGSTRQPLRNHRHVRRIRQPAGRAPGPRTERCRAPSTRRFAGTGLGDRLLHAQAR